MPDLFMATLEGAGLPPPTRTGVCCTWPSGTNGVECSNLWSVRRERGTERPRPPRPAASQKGTDHGKRLF